MPPLQNKSPVNQAKQITMPYSPTKIKAKKTLPSSRFKPLISSLSPSAKSKGARLVSATTLSPQTGKIKRKIRDLQRSKEECPVKMTTDKIIRANLISYLTL